METDEPEAGAAALANDWHRRLLWARRIPRELAVVATAALAISTVAFFRVPLLPSIGADLALRPALLSLVTVVFGVGRLLADLPAGRLADRLAPATGLALGAVVVGGGSFLLAGAGSFAATLAAAAVLGVGSSVANTTAMTFFAHAPRERRGASMALFSAALLGGQSLGPAFAGLLTGLGGWRVAEVVAGAGAVVIAALCVAAGPGAAARRREERPDASPALDVDPAALPIRVVLYAVPFTVFFTLGAMPQTVVPLIAAHGYGLSAGAIGLALGLGGVCRFAGAGLGGFVSDRLGRKVALVPGLVLMAAGVAALELDAGTGVLVAAIVALSLGSYGISVGATMLADLSGTRARGRRLGGFRFAGDGGLIVGPLVAGFLYDRFGTATSVLTVAAVVLACAAAAAVVLPETLHRR